MGHQIGLYGGSFNPVHFGHLIVARAIAEQVGLDRVVILPSARPPHKDAGDLLEASHREEMIRLAIEGEKLFELSDFDLRREGLSYTIDTVKHFRGQLGPEAVVCWMIGADSLAELAAWHRVSDLVDSCRIVTAGRPGWDRIDWEGLRSLLGDDRVKRLRAGIVRTPLVGISSTLIRDRVRNGRSIRYLVPQCVADYIDRLDLYRDAARDGPDG